MNEQFAASVNRHLAADGCRGSLGRSNGGRALRASRFDRPAVWPRDDVDVLAHSCGVLLGKLRAPNGGTDRA